MSLNETATLVCAYMCEKCSEVVAEYRFEHNVYKLPNCVTCYTDMKLLRKVNKLTGERMPIESDNFLQCVGCKYNIPFGNTSSVCLQQEKMMKNLEKQSHGCKDKRERVLSGC
jgi:hypothetical protein